MCTVNTACHLRCMPGQPWRNPRLPALGVGGPGSGQAEAGARQLAAWVRRVSRSGLRPGLPS